MSPPPPDQNPPHGAEPPERPERAPTPDDLPASPSSSYNPPRWRDRDAGEPLPDAEELPQGSEESTVDRTASQSARLHRGWAGRAGRYRLVRPVGKGAMGEVWEAIQEGLWRRVAVKHLHSTDRAGVRDTDWAERTFQGEAMIAALLDHPNIVPVYEYGRAEDGRPLMAMKYVQGSSWHTLLLRDREELEPGEYLERHLPILRQVCQAVAFAHSRGVAHLDLKPSQVMVGDFGEVLLMDWGLAIRIDRDGCAGLSDIPEHLYPVRDTAHGPAGTPGYMAPEQTEATTANLGPWTDCYLLGGVLFFLLGGVPPHEGSTSEEAFRNALAGKIRDIGKLAPDWPKPPELVELCHRALRLLPRDRPTAPEILQSLDAYLTGRSQRMQSLEITRTVAQSPPAESYPQFTDQLTRLDSAKRIWPANPDCDRLRLRLLDSYARLALKRGDLALARAQSEQISDARARHALLLEVEAAERRVAGARRRVRGLLATVALLVLLVAVSSLLFSHRLSSANQLVREQLQAADAARSAEREARQTAQRASTRAQVLLADSLVAQGREDQAIRELLRIPEDQRAWEWSYVLTRAHDSLWTSPFEYLQWSPSRRLALGFEARQGLWLLHAESGRPIFKLADAQPPELVVAFSRDESRIALAEGADVRTWATGDGEVLAEFATPGDEAVRALEYSPDAQQLAVGDSNGRVWVTDVPGVDLVPLAQHERYIRAIYWGDEKIVSISSSSIVRSDPETAHEEIVYQTWAIESQWHGFHYHADRDREFFAAAHSNSRTVWGRIDEGGVSTIDVQTRYLAMEEELDHLIVTGFPRFPHYAIVDLNTGERVRREPVPYRQLANTYPDGITVEDLDIVLPLNNGREVLVTTVEGLWLASYPDMMGIRPLAQFRTGYRRALPLPNGKAYWVVDAQGRTHTKPLDGVIVGDTHHTNVTHYFEDDSKFSAYGSNWLEHRDARTNEMLFKGGWDLRLYAAVGEADAGATIYIAGLRGPDFIIEATDVGTGKVTRRHNVEPVPGAFAMRAESHLAAFAQSDPRRIQIVRLDGAQLENQATIELPASEELLEFDFSVEQEELILASTSGALRTYDPNTGVVLREVDAHDGAVTTLRRVDSPSRWLTIGADNAVRLWTTDGLEPAGEVAFGFPPIGAAISSDGARVLAWESEGAPEVRVIETGELVSRLERIDFPMGSSRFIWGDERIVAARGEEARFWNPNTGEEAFQIDKGYGGLSGDARRFIFKEHMFLSSLLDLAPTQGEDGRTFEQELARWKVQRYAQWAAGGVQSRRAQGADRIAFIDGEVGGPGFSRTARALIEVLDESKHFSTGRRRALADILGRTLCTLPDSFEVYWLGAVNSLVVRLLSQAPEVPTESYDSGLVLLAARTIQDFEANTYPTDPHIPDIALMYFDALTRIEERRGDEESAAALARRGELWRTVVGFAPNYCTRFLEVRGLPSPHVPEELKLGAATSLSPFALSIVQASTPMEEKADFDAARERAWAAHRERVMELLDREAPLPMSWSEMEEAERQSPGWKPYPPGTLVSELEDQVADVFREAELGRLTVSEAAEAERRRVLELFAHVLDGAPRAGSAASAGAAE